MAYRFQFRTGSLEEWNTVNPQLADAEIGLVRGTNLYKIGAAWTQEEINQLTEEQIQELGGTPEVGTLKKWKSLPFWGFNGTLSDTIDVSEGEPIDNEALSKKVILDVIKELNNKISEKASEETLEIITVQIGTIQDTITSQESTLEGLQNKNQIYDDEIEGIKETQNKHTIDIQTLQQAHQVYSESIYQEMVNNEMIEDDVFYYTYSEE